LLEQGANVNLRDNRGTTPVYWAASRGHKEIASLLIENGAVVNYSDDRRWTAMDHAKSNGDKEMIAILEEALTASKTA